MEQSELDIINAMLSAIGDFPVIDLADEEDSVSNIDADVLKARTLLRTLNSEQQARGWWFNTETWEFVPVAGEVILPTNCLRIKDSVQYTNRTGKLYDVASHTYTIEETVELPVVLELDYEALPYSFYAYLKAMACLRFFMNEDGDKEQASMLSSVMAEQYKLVQDEDISHKAPNIFSGNPTVSQVLNGLTNRRQ